MYDMVSDIIVDNWGPSISIDDPDRRCHQTYRITNTDILDNDGVVTNVITNSVR